MKHSVITIAREHGSGGRRIGKQLAEQLGIAYYDKSLIQLAAKQSGLAEETFEEAEKQATSSFLFHLAMGSYSAHGYAPGSLPMADQIFLAQFDAIMEIAEKGPCVIIGRCADYVLRERAGCLNVFLHAPLEERKKRMVLEYGVSPEKCAEEVRRADKGRANYYNHYTGRKWGDCRNYHLTINTSLGEEKVLELIRRAVE